MVCLGNICRSPMAEAVFRDRVEKAGLARHIAIDSAGTGGWHTGERAHPGTLKILSEQAGIDYRGRARQITKADLDQFDYVLAMDTENLSAIRHLGEPQRAQVRLFLEDAHTAGTADVREVPDPYYTGGFDRVYQVVTAGSDALLARIRRERGV
jgi:protein-tyrosine phosphatase